MIAQPMHKNQPDPTNVGQCKKVTTTNSITFKNLLIFNWSDFSTFKHKTHTGTYKYLLVSKCPKASVKRKKMGAFYDCSVGNSQKS